MTIPKIYTLEEVADILKVSKNTMYDLLKSGQLQGVKVGREWRITEDMLMQFLHSTATDPTQQD